eukprot:Clim_evm40s215 gene=Clim_evmTU40s215
MNNQMMQQFEELCQQMYTAPDPASQKQAESTVLEFTDNIQNLLKLHSILEQSNSPYCLVVVANSLTKLVTNNFANISPAERLNLRNATLNRLYNKPDWPRYTVQHLTSLTCRITKLGWFDSAAGTSETPRASSDTAAQTWVMQSIVDDLQTFFMASIEHAVIGIQLEAQLVDEMNQGDPIKSLTRHRKIATSFRDGCLLRIFESCLDLLAHAMYGQSLNLSNHPLPNFLSPQMFQGQINVESSQFKLLQALVFLSLRCLCFDFIGTSPDESAEDIGTVQLPSTWRSRLQEGKVLSLFFDIFRQAPPPISSKAMETLVQLASVRRSLFNDRERVQYLKVLTDNCREVLRSGQSLGDMGNYHEFCRLLSKLKINFQLNELVSTENYSELIEMITKFTVQSVESYQWAPSSVHYLLNLWQRLVASMPYARSTNPSYLEKYTPEVTKAFIMARIGQVEYNLRNNGGDDLLEDPDQMSTLLDQIAVIARCQYAQTCELMISAFDPTYNEFQELAQRLATSQGDQALEQRVAILEGQLTWMVYFIGAMLGGRINLQSVDEHDMMDGELATRVMQLMKFADARLEGTQAGSVHMELSILHFFQEFRQTYVGDHVQKSSKVYQRLSDRFGVQDQSQVLNVFLTKIVANLRYWASNESVVSQSLKLLGDLCQGYSTVRMLRKLDLSNMILQNHHEFPFLESLNNTRHRTTFYTALGRLLFVENQDEDDKFERFMDPFKQVVEWLRTQMTPEGRVSPQADVSRVQSTIVGLCRDFRGIVAACTKKASYMSFFDWFYPNHMEPMTKCFGDFAGTPTVADPFLKFTAELVHNRSQRLEFDISSPNGILLFRETSKIICAYGEEIVRLSQGPPIGASELYSRKYKGIAVVFNILRYSLCGHYVNFGVFKLYNDPALDNTLNMFIKLLCCVPVTDLLQYPKLTKSYFSLLEIFTTDHLSFILNLNQEMFRYVLMSVSEGIKSVDTGISSNCCLALDNIVTFHFKTMQKGKQTDDGMALMQRMNEYNDIIPRTLNYLLNTIFESCPNQWSVSRPLLGLILLNPDYYKSLSESIIGNQPQDRQPQMRKCFDALMHDIDNSLAAKNRDKFTQHLTIFRRDINNFMRAPEIAPSPRVLVNNVNGDAMM